MEPSNSKTSKVERRFSARQSTRVSMSGADEQEFALAAMGISDGFQGAVSQNMLSEGTTTPNSSTTHSQSPRSRDVMQQLAPQSRPSSIAKTRYNDSLSLQNEGNSANIPNSTRDSIESFDNPFIAPNEAPYNGPTGPSFPYQMYPQNIRSNRTASVSATSTAANTVPEALYNGLRGPTHPYGMYPQNTVGGEEMAPDMVPSSIPVGFPGATDQYRRREHDAADLIGPDGHTEELPPYTRYPDEAYVRKIQGPGQSLATVATVNHTQSTPNTQRDNPTGASQPQPQTQIAISHPTAPTATPTLISETGDIRLLMRDPESSGSTDDLGSRSRYSAQSFGSQTSTRSINNSASNEASNEKAHSKWKQRAEKRLWGVIPYWAICLVFSSLIIMGIILGAVIGTFLVKKDRHPSRKDHDSKSTAVPATVTVTLDATPLSTVPANLRDLDEGDFALPIASAARSSKTCFNNTFQSNAWSCDIVFSQLMISLTKLNGNPPTNSYAVNLSCNQSLTINEGRFSYGTQPPCFNENHTMELVTDLYEPELGPAWFFQMPYDKIVILPESFLSLNDASIEASEFFSHREKRFRIDSGYSFSESSKFQRKGVADPGEKPWICTWGGTLLEVFIYANQDSVGYMGYTSMSAAGSSYFATATENTFARGSLSTATPTSSLNLDISNDGFILTDGVESVTTVTATTTITNPFGSETEDPNASTTYGQWDTNGPSLPPPPYPRVVKIEERRLNGFPALIPTCQQFEIFETEARPVKDDNGNEIIIEIGETEPEPILMDVDDLIPRYIESTVAESSKRAVRITPREFEHLTGGLYSIDRDGNIRERSKDDDILVGQDLSDCGCIWWTD